MHKLLLVNPSISDIRLDWARWHQPGGLLQVGSYLLEHKNDVRLIDCLRPIRGDRIPRSKADSIIVEGISFQRWHFGWTWDQLEKRLQAFKEDEWTPDTIYVTCMMTFWWESAQDLIRRLKIWLPNTRIVLGGVYPAYCPEHARQHLPDVELDTVLGRKAKRKPTAFDLYQPAPRFAGLYLYRSRSPHQIVQEIQAKLEQGAREFAFFDDVIPGANPDHFEDVLDLIIERKLKIRFLALGNLPPDALNRSLAVKMRKAGYRQIWFRDNLPNQKNAKHDLRAYTRAVKLSSRYGKLKPRSEDLTAMVVVGLPNEKLENVVERITQLAHIVGSVNLVPYQPTPGTPIYGQHQEYLDKIPLELQNGKLFPFAKLNGYTLADYQELIRLASLLNSKFHSTTFDFLGQDGISKMVRKSVAEQLYLPKLKPTIPLLPK